jgi:diguanylate cyclase (GGDEF)-like protein
VDTPQNTLLVVLQMVSIVLALLMIVAVQQVRQRRGVALWVAAFGAMALTQFGRELVEVSWGFHLGRSFGHVGGPLGYGLLYIGIRIYLGLVPRVAWSLLAIATAAIFSAAAVYTHQNYVSLATTTCFTALFQVLTASVLWRVWRHEGGVARVGAAATFALSALFSLGRAITVIPEWHPGMDLVGANTLWLLEFIAMMIVQAGCLQSLVNQSLVDELQNMADYDPLTGLLNRGGLARRMLRHGSRMPVPGKQLGVLCLDLDHFKAVNDNYGHGAGDDVLKCVGSLLRENCRTRDIPSRQGGEEFGMILEVRSEQELVALGGRLRTLIERIPVPTRVGDIKVTVSIGVAIRNDPMESLDAIRDRADLALLRAKREGRNRVELAAIDERPVASPVPAIAAVD